jgi:Domain of unknown function (DUF4352)
MSWRGLLIGCGGFAALGVVLFIVLLIGIATGGGGDTDRTERLEAEKKPPPKKKPASQNVEAVVGESAELEDRALVVNDVQRNFTPESRVGQPKVGNELVRVFVTLTNTSNQPFAYNPNNFKVQYSSGVQRIPHSVPDLPYPVRHGSLAPGGPLEGNMVFEVPQGDRGIHMVYEPFERERLGTVTVTL